MRCADFNRLLELVEGTLDPEQQRATRQHLRECAECRMLLAEVERLGSGPRPADPAIPPPPVEVGERVGRYVVTGWLGAGGMGVVLRAHDPDLRRDVALKVIVHSGGRETDRESLLREARHTAQISHPNVVSVFDVGAEGRRVFIAMELVEGESLARWLAAATRPSAEILAAFGKAGKGLEAAHRAGVVHGDFKPANVLTGRDGQVKVTDFGLSRAVAKDLEEPAGEPPGAAHAESTGARASARLAGTPRYLAPELWIGRRPTARSDQFSFAVALYEALYDGRGRAGSAGAGLPGPALVRAMSADPAARHASMGALLEGLGERPRPRWRWAAAWASLAVAAGVAAVALPATRPLTAPPVAAMESAQAPLPRTMVDGPPPETSRGEAAEAYRAALVAYHDASSDAGMRLMQRALQLDPDLAAAHLRYALYGDVPIRERREHVERATQLRTRLTEPDRALLGAAESLVQMTRESYAEYVARLGEAARRFPGDAEIALVEASARARLELPPAGTEVTRAARELDPGFAQAFLGEAEIAVWQGDPAHALRALDACVALSPSATSCLRLEAVVHGLAGECDATRSLALAVVSADPKADRAYALLAMALAATGAPLESVHEALRTREELVGPESGPLPRLRDEAQLAAFSGDFVTAEARLREIDAIPDAEYAGMAHEGAFEQLLLYEETGQTDRAVAVAEDYLKRFAGWPHGFWGRARPIALATLRRAGRISEAQFATDRQAWAQEERDKNLPIEASLAWVDYYARLSRTRGEALEALAALPQELPLSKPKGLHWNDDPIYILHREGIGRTLLLGGRPREALESLELASRSCMGLEEPWAYVQAHLELGQALEAVGDPAGACRAYAEVTARWGAARPRSTSAEVARTRMGALRCK